MSIHTHEEATP